MAVVEIVRSQTGTGKTHDAVREAIAAARRGAVPVLVMPDYESCTSWTDFVRREGLGYRIVIGRGRLFCACRVKLFERANAITPEEASAFLNHHQFHNPLVDEQTISERRVLLQGSRCCKLSTCSELREKGVTSPYVKQIEPDADRPTVYFTSHAMLSLAAVQKYIAHFTRKHVETFLDMIHALNDRSEVLLFVDEADKFFVDLCRPRRGINSCSLAAQAGVVRDLAEVMEHLADVYRDKSCLNVIRVLNSLHSSLLNLHEELVDVVSSVSDVDSGSNSELIWVINRYGRRVETSPIYTRVEEIMEEARKRIKSCRSLAVSITRNEAARRELDALVDLAGEITAVLGRGSVFGYGYVSADGVVSSAFLPPDVPKVFGTFLGLTPYLSLVRLMSATIPAHMVEKLEKAVSVANEVSGGEYEVQMRKRVFCTHDNSRIVLVTVGDKKYEGSDEGTRVDAMRHKNVVLSAVKTALRATGRVVLLAVAKAEAEVYADAIEESGVAARVVRLTDENIASAREALRRPGTVVVAHYAYWRGANFIPGTDRIGFVISRLSFPPPDNVEFLALEAAYGPAVRWKHVREEVVTSVTQAVGRAIRRPGTKALVIVCDSRLLRFEDAKSRSKMALMTEAVTQPPAEEFVMLTVPYAFLKTLGDGGDATGLITCALSPRFPGDDRECVYRAYCHVTAAVARLKKSIGYVTALQKIAGRFVSDESVTAVCNTRAVSAYEERMVRDVFSALKSTGVLKVITAGTISSVTGLKRETVLSIAEKLGIELTDAEKSGGKAGKRGTSRRSARSAGSRG